MGCARPPGCAGWARTGALRVVANETHVVARNGHWAHCRAPKTRMLQMVPSPPRVPSTPARRRAAGTPPRRAYGVGVAGSGRALEQGRDRADAGGAFPEIGPAELGGRDPAADPPSAGTSPALARVDGRKSLRNQGRLRRSSFRNES